MSIRGPYSCRLVLTVTEVMLLMVVCRLTSTVHRCDAPSAAPHGASRWSPRGPPTPATYATTCGTSRGPICYPTPCTSGECPCFSVFSKRNPILAIPRLASRSIHNLHHGLRLL